VRALPVVGFDKIYGARDPVSGTDLCAEFGRTSLHLCVGDGLLDRMRESAGGQLALRYRRRPDPEGGNPFAPE
jgi:hypothetical protein